MADIVFTNNASALLAASIGTGDTSIQVAAGFGALFPSPGAGEYFNATLEDSSGNIEIVQCTSRATDILTVVRAQEGTVAQAFTLTVTRVELRVTKAMLEEFAQLSGFLMVGNIDLDTNDLIDANITGTQTRFTQGQIAGVPLRGAVDSTGNEINVPVDDQIRATAGGASILVTGDDIMAELDDLGIILFDSATVGLQVPGGAYLRVEGPTPANHIILTHDDTDATFAFLNTTLVNWDTLLSMAAPIDMNENELRQIALLDFSLKKQSLGSGTIVDIDYEAGSYAIITMTGSITDLNVINLPAGDVATVRVKVIQSTGGSHLITNYVANVKWARGVVPTLSTVVGDIDFIDLWTDDGGTSWYGSFDTDWA